MKKCNVLHGHVFVMLICMLGNFARFCHLLIFLKRITFSKNILHEYHQSVDQFGSRSGTTFDFGLICLQMLSTDDTVRVTVHEIETKYT